MNWDKYDNWKLASPPEWENEIEVFKADKYNRYSTCEEDIQAFDDAMESVKYHVISKEYESREEYLEECQDNFEEEFNIHCEEWQALEAYQDDEYNQYLDAVENGYRGKFRRKF